MSKAPVLMIHGAFCGPWSLDGLKQKFEAAGYAVTAPALRFHDQKRAPSALATTGLADYAADLEDEIAALKAPPILVGHSMGGLLAQMLAARVKVAALVLLAPSPPWGVTPTTLFEIGAAHSMHLQPGHWNQVLEPNRDVALAHSLDRLPRDMRDSVYGRFVAESGRAMFEVMNWAMDFNQASAVDVDAVTAPLLFLTGSDDKINPPSTVAQIAALYGAKATAEVLDGMGHWLIGEPGWEKLAERALSWLEKQKL
ncbi:MAG: alpha/beta hydrolase [Alphaproteobacteria bacterium]|nr:alpha/beta hydrolase [Alphaproteobacteria bacterium]